MAAGPSVRVSSRATPTVPRVQRTLNPNPGSGAITGLQVRRGFRVYS